MQMRVDDYSSAAPRKWFGVSIYDGLVRKVAVKKKKLRRN